MMKKCVLLCICILLAGMYPLKVRAEEMPDVIRYEELETLVKAYSPQIQMEQARYDSRLARYENARQDIMETRRLLREEAEDLEKVGDMDGASQYRAQAKTLEDAAKDMDKQIRSAQGSSASMSLRRMEDTVLWTAQNLMGTYNTLKADQEAALAQAEWKQSQYEKLQRQVQAGSASGAQADQAGKEADAAAAKAKAVRDEMERVKKELFILTGYPEGSQAEIGPMPAPQPDRVLEMGGSTDKWRALGNNYSLREQRSGEPAPTRNSTPVRGISIRVRRQCTARWIPCTRKSWPARHSGPALLHLWRPRKPHFRRHPTSWPWECCHARNIWRQKRPTWMPRLPGNGQTWASSRPWTHMTGL